MLRLFPKVYTSVSLPFWYVNGHPIQMELQTSVRSVRGEVVREMQQQNAAKHAKKLQVL